MAWKATGQPQVRQQRGRWVVRVDGVEIERAGLPRLTSHGLRHTAATLMVRESADVGERRAVADILGHSPDMLMKVYAHTLPESLRSVTAKIGARANP